MRNVAQYSFQATAVNEADATTLAKAASKLVETWLDNKGNRDPSSGTIILNDGRRANFSSDHLVCDLGTSHSWNIEEPSEGGIFATSISLALSESVVTFACSLSVGFLGDVVSPLAFSARCPQVIRDILNLSSLWQLGTTRLSPISSVVSTDTEAEALAKQILSPTRNLPLVVISRSDGLLLHPDIVSRMSADLAGLALVVDLADKASWILTRELGKEHSCFGGAIRIYWPRFLLHTSPNANPLWTSQRLLRIAYGTDKVAKQVRHTIRKRIFAVSAFAIQPAAIFDAIQRQHARTRLDERIKKAIADNDFREIAETYARDNDDLKQKLSDEKKLVTQLREDLYRLQTTKAWEADQDEVPPVTEDPPNSVQEAVDRARRMFAAELTFGDDVNDGIRTLATDAGPPEKIFEYLEYLAEMTKTLRKEPLGDTKISWLAKWGVKAGNESETILNNKNEMKKRTWRDGRTRRPFEMHLKPQDATAPDYCARIYFAWDDASAKTVIGWVGRHP